MVVRPVPKEAKMNKATGLQEKSGHEKPAHAAGVGNEKKADVKGAQHGEPTDGQRSPGPGHTHLSGAMHELHSQHPIPYHDHGPHHGTEHHVRHKPLHGMKSGGGY
jgi:hypothetical protein